MNDPFRALYEEYASHRGAGDAYTLSGGRFYRAQAPSGATFPYIVMTAIGGNRQPFFGADTLETSNVQLSVFDEYTDDAHDAKPAGAIWQSLVEIFNNATLTMRDFGSQVCIRQISMPREMIDGDIIHINGDWALERQVTR